mmetsp:Transcript_93581/g.222469  ORF Transcript_93581/g.222469 Transcript_93581/m.222469 type:complete len:159 (-) Transcript_93581:54-530(-)
MPQMRRGRLLSLALLGAAGCALFNALQSFVPGLTEPSAARQPRATGTAAENPAPALNEEASSSFPAVPAIAALSVAMVLLSSQPAHAVLPPEEQQGYIQNFLGYANLVLNFLSGYFGMVFGPAIRALTKPGPVKYFIAAAGLGGLVLLVLVVKAMVAV